MRWSCGPQYFTSRSPNTAGVNAPIVMARLVAVMRYFDVLFHQRCQSLSHKACALYALVIVENSQNEGNGLGRKGEGVYSPIRRYQSR